MKTRGLPRVIRYGWLLGLLSLICSCAYFSMPDRHSSHSLHVTTSALDFYQRVMTASAEQIRETSAALEARADYPNRAIYQIQQALLISAPSVADDDSNQRALDLLNDLDYAGLNYSTFTSDYLQLGFLWRTLLQQRIDSGLTAAELRNLRAEFDYLRLENEELRRQVQRLTERNQQLYERIDALTTIEQQLNRREQESENGPGN